MTTVDHAKHLLSLADRSGTDGVFESAVIMKQLCQAVIEAERILERHSHGYFGECSATNYAPIEWLSKHAGEEK